MNKLISAIACLKGLVRHGDRGMSTVSRETNTVTAIERLAVLLEGFFDLLKMVSFKGFVVTGMLLLVIVMSAIGVVYSSHLSRQLFAEQAILLERNDQLQLEWAQLLLEQSAWSSPNRIETVARDSLKMDVPATEEIQLIY